MKIKVVDMNKVETFQEVASKVASSIPKNKLPGKEPTYSNGWQWSRVSLIGDLSFWCNKERGVFDEKN